MNVNVFVGTVPRGIHTAMFSIAGKTDTVEVFLAELRIETEEMTGSRVMRKGILMGEAWGEG